MQFLAFVAAAAVSLPATIATRILLSRFVPFELAVIVAHIAGMITAYAGMRTFVFEASGRPPTLEFVRFGLVNMVSLTQTWLVSVVFLRGVFPALGVNTYPELFSHLIGLGSTAITSFVLHSRFSFKPLRASEK